jgi:hypothetical protein
MEAKNFTEDFMHGLMVRKVRPKIVEIGKIETCNDIHMTTHSHSFMHILK